MAEPAPAGLALFPHGAWDVHHHIFDPARFPYSPTRHLTPPPATIAEYAEFKKKLGITHSVLTHGLSYGADISSLTSFVCDLDKSKTKAIGVIDPETITPTQLHQMQKAGIVGIRVNLYQYSAMHDVDLQKEALRAHVTAIRDCQGWSMAFTHVHPEFWAELKPFILSEIVPTGIRLVTDHFALLKGVSMLSEPTSASGENAGEVDVLAQPGVAEILDLMRAGHLYVKISAPYRAAYAADEGPDGGGGAGGDAVSGG
ncbi:amidohydrolase family protein [Aspergillus mulundensis]|uniref:Amidohydrolase-related domain-containing protein n=1 Tax=Aspergillus mulundensis TaxID=1810919 RepID=A0A3D8QAQ3_9EURO|nr:Uncharacterized protein DSM5745_11129 [Aspergillus mulundensis]RDW58923.1 Uncharacterized protein DSM5745_11129 [Aspergillus mulundensis]